MTLKQINEFEDLQLARATIKRLREELKKTKNNTCWRCDTGKLEFNTGFCLNCGVYQ